MKIKVCILLDADLESEKSSFLIDKNYKLYVKDILSFLTTHKSLPITIIFTSFQIERYIQKYPEAIEILHNLISKKNIEILGDGYYSPIFPLISPLDRLGQIEKMSILIKSAFGKKISGIRPFFSIWDQSLIGSFCASGLDYVFLDSDIIPKEKLMGFPLIVSDLGKKLKVFPIENYFAPQKNESAQRWVLRIENIMQEKGTLYDFYERDNDERFSKVITFSITQDVFWSLVNNSFFDNFFAINSNISLTLPSLYLKKNNCFIKSYIPPAMGRKISEWCNIPFEKKNVNIAERPLYIYDFLNTYPQVQYFHERTIFIGTLISQTKGGDKARKKKSNEFLWEAQAGRNYIAPSGLPASEKNRQDAFRLLSKAEALIRESLKSFNESVTSYDYNGDGLNEYVCQMEQYSAVLSQKNAIITDFNFIKSSANYAENLYRIKKFDGFFDLHRRGFFQDYLFSTKEQFCKYKKEKYIENSFCFNILAKEHYYNFKRHEVRFEMPIFFLDRQPPIILEKIYTFFSSSVTVQYIFKNNGETDFKGIFAVELNLAQTRFEKKFEQGSQYFSEYIQGEKTVEPCTTFNAERGISFVKITDIADRKNFILEPNEEGGVSTSLIYFSRPSDVAQLQDITASYVTTLFWDITIASGREKEKTITLAVSSLKNRENT